MTRIRRLLLLRVTILILSIVTVLIVWSTAANFAWLSRSSQKLEDSETEEEANQATPRSNLARQISQAKLDRLLAGPPPWLPMDQGALDRNFAAVSRTAWRLLGGYSPMRLRVPEFSSGVNGWRLSSPSGRARSVESVQRQLLLGSGGLAVPNAAHYILPFADTRFRFHHMISVLSCLHVMRPQLLLLWQPPDRPPTGRWWSALRRNLSSAEWESRVVMATRQVPGRVYSRLLSSAEHQSDVMRLEALLTFGGVYLDLDVVVLKPLEPLRLYDFVIGREQPRGLCNGAMLSAPNSTFAAMWHLAYQMFDRSSWAAHSVQLPDRLQRAFPQLCRVEPESIARPNWTPEESAMIYDQGRQSGWDWRRRNYLLHLWYRVHNREYDERDIRRLDSMFGEICRFILYGTAGVLASSEGR